jgi:hypothetical protein
MEKIPLFFLDVCLFTSKTFNIMENYYQRGICVAFNSANFVQKQFFSPPLLYRSIQLFTLQLLSEMRVSILKIIHTCRSREYISLTCIVGGGAGVGLLFGVLN